MVIGAIGGESLGEEAQQVWLRNAIRSWLVRLDVELGYTNLEPGAGLLFAEILSSAAIPYRVILPCRLNTGLVGGKRIKAIKQGCRKATAVHLLSRESQKQIDWQESRIHVLEQCDVVLAVFTGTAAEDGPIKIAQINACASQRAVISFDLMSRQSKIICKSDQW